MASQEGVQVARRAEQLYEERLRHILEKTHYGAFVAIEPESGDYYLGSSIREVINLARAAHPTQLCHVIRVTEDKAAVFVGSAES